MQMKIQNKKTRLMKMAGVAVQGNGVAPRAGRSDVGRMTAAQLLAEVKTAKARVEPDRLRGAERSDAQKQEDKSVGGLLRTVHGYRQTIERLRKAMEQAEALIAYAEIAGSVGMKVQLEREDITELDIRNAKRAVRRLGRRLERADESYVAAYETLRAELAKLRPSAQPILYDAQMQQNGLEALGYP